MKITPVSVIIEHLANGAPIEAFTGTIVKLYGMKNVGSGESAWTKQNGEIRDSVGDIIPVEFRLQNVEIPQSAKGKSILIQSKAGERGLVGLTVMDDEYPAGKFTRKLKVTPQAVYKIEGEGEPARQQHTDRPQNTAPANTGTAAAKPAASHDPPPPTREDGIRAGMCINNAVEIIKSWPVTAAYYGSPQFGLDLWNIASRISRVAKAMEAGKLDPSTAREKAPPKPAPPPRLEEQDDIDF